jgi:hypothetical protein
MPPQNITNSQPYETKYDKNLFTVNMFNKPIKKELRSASNISRLISIIQNIDKNRNESKKILLDNIHYLLYTDEKDENNDTLLHRLANFSNDYPTDDDFNMVSSKLGGVVSSAYLKSVFDKIIDLIITDPDIKNEISNMKLSKRINNEGYNPYVVSTMNDSEHNSSDPRANKIKLFFDEVERMERASYGGRKNNTRRRLKRKTQKRKKNKNTKRQHKIRYSYKKFK